MAVKFDKKYLIAGGVTLAVVLLTSGYIFWLPTKAASSYTTQSKETYAKVSTAMNKVYETFGKDLFTKMDQGAVAGKAEAKAALSTISEAEAAIAQSSAKTKLQNLPGASINSSYKSAQKLSQDQARYFADARAFLSIYKETLTYVNASLDITVEAEAAGTELGTAVYTEEDLAVATTKLQSAITKMQAVQADTKKLTPPKSLAALHEKGIKENDQLIAIMQKMLDAWKTLDETKESAALTELTTLIDQADTSWTKDLIKLQNDSELAKSIEKLKTAQRELGNSL